MPDIRQGGPADMPALADIFWRGVQEGAAPRYSAAQRRAWLPAPPTPAAFAVRLADQHILVATREDSLVGFMTLRADGYLDFAYVLPAERRQGTADTLLTALQTHARATRLTRLTTRASAMARPFFARHGWQDTGDATTMRDGIPLPSTHMAFDLF